MILDVHMRYVFLVPCVCSEEFIVLYTCTSESLDMCEREIKKKIEKLI